jgi:hypothetical protein
VTRAQVAVVVTPHSVLDWNELQGVCLVLLVFVVADCFYLFTPFSGFSGVVVDTRFVFVSIASA